MRYSDIYLHIMGFLKSCHGSRFDKELVYSSNTHDITARDVTHRGDLAAHQDDGPGVGLVEQIVGFPGLVLRTHDADFHSRGYGARKDSPEGKEATFVSGRYHFGDVNHERSISVALFHC